MSQGLDMEIRTHQDNILGICEEKCGLETFQRVLSSITEEHENQNTAKIKDKIITDSDENLGDSYQEEVALKDNKVYEEDKQSFNEVNNIEAVNFELKSKGKLLKVSTKIQNEKDKKKEAKFRRNEFVDSEAELGSDKEEHDDVVKKIKENDEEDLSDNQEEDLPDLIDKNEENLNIDKDEIQKKFFNEMMDQDKKEIRQVINGPAQRQKRMRSTLDKLPETEDDYLALNMRIKKYKTNGSEDENEPGFIGNFLNIQKQIEENIADQHDEDLKEMLQTYENNKIKKIAEKNVKIDEIIELRNKENDKILENVVIQNNVNKNPLLTNGSVTSKSKDSAFKHNLALNFKFKSSSQPTSLLFGKKDESSNNLFKSNSTNMVKSFPNITSFNSKQPQTTNVFLPNQNKSNLSALFRKNIHNQKLERQQQNDLKNEKKKQIKKPFN
jgi:hypothetical protein